jgi:hypothetical protein
MRRGRPYCNDAPVQEHDSEALIERANAIFKEIEGCFCGANREANMRILVVAILMLLPIQFAKAQTTFSGAGSFSCGAFEQMYHKAPAAAENAYFHWAQGFMSGINITTLAIHSPSRDLSSMSIQNQRNILLRYCDGHPRAYFYQAAMNLYKQLKPLPPRPKR